MNYEIIVTENRKNGYVGRFKVTGKQLNKLERVSDIGGFKRFDIDIYNEINEKPSIKDQKAKENFFENIKLFKP